ncbi:MAG TPA: class F sortase [Actinomycetota bacterium]|nr:class F sortase [Actinomycetota bacterium]
MPARSRPLVALAAAALVLTLGGCAGGPDPSPAGVVDNQEHPAPPSATIPLRGTSRLEGGSGVPGGRTDAPAGRTDALAGGTDAPGTGRFDAPGVPPRAPGFEVGDLPRRPAAPGSGSPPVRLAIPAIGVATPLVRLGLEADGGMQVPADFGRAGWFTEGPAPGQVGPSVIAGHVDSRTGPAVFYRLRELRPGQAILVERADGSRLRFVVEQARSYPKEGFPTAAVFGPVPEAALRLITCTGDFDRARGSYRDNLVVFARLAGQVGADAGNRG